MFLWKEEERNLKFTESKKEGIMMHLKNKYQIIQRHKNKNVR